MFPLSDAARAALGPDFPLPKTMSNAEPPVHTRIRRFSLQRSPPGAPPRWNPGSGPPPWSWSMRCRRAARSTWSPG